ncbi:MAG: SagB/ThcOx family dehydrogenase [bacterium]|nr:SagB/ThcOx family dehydrogenase [bacterium]
MNTKTTFETTFRFSVLFFILFVMALAVIISGGHAMADDENSETTDSGCVIVELPDPVLDSDFSLEETLLSRRSVRSYDDRPLNLEIVSQLLWAAQGITTDWGGRTAPSAGALYPMVIYLVAGDVEGLDPGVWEYDPVSHSISLIREGDLRLELMGAALGQGPVGDAPATLILSAIPSITEVKYGDRSMRYIDTEVGAICQNVYLQCETLGLGTVAMGAFDDDLVAETVGTSASVRLIMPVGWVEE